MYIKTWKKLFYELLLVKLKLYTVLAYVDTNCQTLMSCCVISIHESKDEHINKLIIWEYITEYIRYYIMYMIIYRPTIEYDNILYARYCNVHDITQLFCFCSLIMPVTNRGWKAFVNNNLWEGIDTFCKHSKDDKVKRFVDSVEVMRFAIHCSLLVGWLVAILRLIRPKFIIISITPNAQRSWSYCNIFLFHEQAKCTLVATRVRNQSQSTHLFEYNSHRGWLQNTHA